MTRKELIDHLQHLEQYTHYSEDAPALREAIALLSQSYSTERAQERTETHACDCISRREAIEALFDWEMTYDWDDHCREEDPKPAYIVSPSDVIEHLPSAQPERKWIPCSNPPKHHKDVIVRGIEAIGNVTVHKVMQWDVDTWRPTDYAPSIIWKEWSEI